jgi:potassium efflux system protein
MLKLLATLALFCAVSAWGQVDPPAVTAAEVTAAVDQVSSSLPADDPERETLLKLYGEVSSTLASFEQYRQSISSFAEARSRSPQETVAVSAALAKLQADPAAAEVDPDMSLDELEQRIQLDSAERDAKKARLADLGSTIDGMSARTAEIRSRLTELAGERAELESRLKLMDSAVEPGGEAQARLWLVQAQAAAAAAEKAALDEELLSQPMRLDLLRAQRAQITYLVGTLETQLQVMEQRAGELRLQDADRMQIEAQITVEDALGKHPLVRQLAEQNAELSASFAPRSSEIEDARKRVTLVTSKADQLQSDLQSIERKLAVLGMSQSVGGILREQQAQLPTGRESKQAMSDVAKAIGHSSTRQIELEDDSRQLIDARGYVQGLLEGQDAQVVEQISDDLLSLARARRELVARAIDLENTYSRALGELDFNLHRYAGAIEDYRDFISERLLWIPSREMFSLFRDHHLYDQVTEVFVLERWQQVVFAIPAEMQKKPLLPVALLLILGLFYVSPRLIARLVATGADVGYVRSDRFFNTVRALGLTLLLSLRWPALMLVLAGLFEMQETESELATALYVAAMRMAMYSWGLGFLRILLLPKGMVVRHFRWPVQRTALLYKRVVRLEQTFLPASFLVILAVQLYPRDVGGALASLGMIIVLLSLAQFFRHLPQFAQGKINMILAEGQPGGGNTYARLIRTLLVWIPVAGTVAVLFGYTYTAMEFALLLIKTVVLYCLILLIHELGTRWLRMTRRRMVVRAREGAAQAAGDGIEVSAEEELLENDPELLNDEGIKVLNLLTVFAGLFGLLAIWAHVFPALGILDSVELWSYNSVVDGLDTTVPVTLANFALSLIAAFVGWVTLRRIPSLLEIMLRQRVNISPPTAYAVTRVFQYAGTTALVVLIIGSLGGSWGQIQWAVAALSVGIGFGLQEIVANFISGLIILFEQPIRLGDTVTVGTVSGKVTKIRIRATTIRDFDRRELLVPNKEFITNQLLNWSLSDQVTRWTMDIGVAYGTDMDKAMAIVHDVALRQPLVLHDPESLVTFEEFGDNSLLIRLRLFMDQLDQRLIVASDIRKEINRRFNEEGIVVAFPQRDIHLDTSQPLEIRMVNGPDQPGEQ